MHIVVFNNYIGSVHHSYALQSAARDFAVIHLTVANTVEIDATVKATMHGAVRNHERHVRVLDVNTPPCTVLYIQVLYVVCPALIHETA